MTSPNTPMSVSLPFIAAVALPGAIGLATTPMPQSETAVWRGSFQRAYETAFTEHMPLTDAAQAAYTALALGLFGQAGPDVVIAERDWLFTAEEFRQPTEAVAFQAALNEAQARLAAADITLIPVVIPDKARVYADHLPRARGDLIEARYQNALAMLAAQGFAPVDLEAALTDARPAGDTFMRTDTHWSVFGAQVAAEAIADATALRDTGETVFETTVAGAEPFAGDLLPFVDAGPFAAWVGPAPEMIEVPVTTAQSDGLGLFGDVAIDVVLIGTSFSARTEFNFGGAVQQATGLTLVNLSVEGQGPFRPMQDALDSSAITDLSPTYVLWEIPERYIHSRSFP